MKLVPLVETSNVHAPITSDRLCSCGCGMLAVDVQGLRPMETEADLIAASARPGLVTVRRMIDLFDDDGAGSDGEHDDCLLCTQPNDYIFGELNLDRTFAMSLHDVIYDPTLRL